MSKKKKNSNYKSSQVKVEEKKPTISRNMWIIIAVCSLLVIGLTITIIAVATKNNKKNDDTVVENAFVEMDFGEYGKILLEIDRKNAPITSENFLSLVEDGFYDGLTIFRSHSGFVIQGGENESVSLTPIEGEFASNGHFNPISHKRGVISMARTSAPNSATSQFFITLSDSAAYSLDGEYAGFGYVIEGMDVVDAIASALLPYSTNSMGFVADENAITIVSAKIVER